MGYRDTSTVTISTEFLDKIRPLPKSFQGCTKEVPGESGRFADQRRLIYGRILQRLRNLGCNRPLFERGIFFSGETCNYRSRKARLNLHNPLTSNGYS